jgi:hypothetical protein
VLLFLAILNTGCQAPETNLAEIRNVGINGEKMPLNI